jgi:hypothetical protein
MPDAVNETTLHTIAGYVKIFLTTICIKAGDD